MSKDDKKKHSKHIYSSYLLFLLLLFALVGSAIALTAEGVDGSIQFNDNGTINGTSSFTYNKTTGEFVNHLPNSHYILGEKSLFGGFYNFPIINGTTSFGNALFGVYDNLYIFDSGSDASGSIMYFSSNDNSIFGSISIDTDNGDFTYSARKHIFIGMGQYNEVNFQTPVTYGSNTKNGLSNGDINVSTVYYDTLTAKSPVMLCSKDDHRCFMIDLVEEKEYYVTIDDNYNIISAKNKESKKKEAVTDKIQKKLDKLKCEKDGFSVMVNETCIVNPYLECVAQSDTEWNFETNSCDYSEKKACESVGNAWDEFTQNCLIIDSTPTLEDLKNECLNNKATIWYNDACISLETYYG